MDIHTCPLLKMWAWLRCFCLLVGKQKQQGHAHIFSTCAVGTWIFSIRHTSCRSNIAQKLQVFKSCVLHVQATQMLKDKTVEKNILNV